MQRISWKQTKAVLASLDVLYSEPEPATLPARILGALKAAVASETILVDGFGPSDQMEPLAQHPVGHMTPHDYSTLARYLPQHPLFPLVILAKRTGPLRTAEVASAQRFSRTALYDEMFRPMSISDQMIMRVNGPQGTFITCCLNRVRKEFSEGGAQDPGPYRVASSLGRGQCTVAGKDAGGRVVPATSLRVGPEGHSGTGGGRGD